MKRTVLKKLSPREQEIIVHLAQGLLYKEIAAELCISVETVRTHVSNIYQKLEVSSRTDALNRIFKPHRLLLKCD